MWHVTCKSLSHLHSKKESPIRSAFILRPKPAQKKSNLTNAKRSNNIMIISWYQATDPAWWMAIHDIWHELANICIQNTAHDIPGIQCDIDCESKQTKHIKRNHWFNQSNKGSHVKQSDKETTSTLRQGPTQPVTASEQEVYHVNVEEMNYW